MTKKHGTILFIFVMLNILFCSLLLANFPYDKFPKLLDVLHFLFNEIRNKEYQYNILITLLRVLKGFLLAVVVSLNLLIISLLYKPLKNVLIIIVEVFRPIPNAIWIPVSILLFHEIESSIQFIIFLGAFFPIFVNVIRGLDDIDNNYIRISKTLDLDFIERLYQVVIPAITDQIFSGLSLGMSGAWLAVVMAEIIGGQNGIGYEAWKCYTLVNLTGVLSNMIILGFLGLSTSFILNFIKCKFVKWEK